MKHLTCLFVVFSASDTPISAVKLFETPGDISTTVPARCRIALTYNITCDFLVTTDQAQQEYHLVGDALTSYCSDSCSESIAEFQQSVTDACGHTLYAFQEDSERKSSAQALAEGFSWAQNLMCIQEGDDYCLGAKPVPCRS